MQYRKLGKNKEKLSLLGYGCMRFPKKAGVVNKDLTFKQLHYAYKKGVNYFDTAYIYHGGKSEVILGEFIKKYDLRKKVYIADKLPAYLVRKKEQISTFFDSQLERLDTDYIDYYLMHSLDSMKTWERLKSFGIVDFLKEKKALGAIKKVGFSFHGRKEDFAKILKDYPWDFCQIQYNYLDENYQAGRFGLELAYKMGIGVIVMEPLRGGSLANKVPASAKKIFEKYPRKRSAAHWGLRFVMNRPEVSVVLSGMNEFSQIKENAMICDETAPLSMSAREEKIIEKVKNIYLNVMKISCTGCEYCMPCPFGVNIPEAFSDYNNRYLFKKKFSPSFNYLRRATGLFGGIRAGADACVNCQKCVKKCPQHIDIPKELKVVDKELDNVFLRWTLEVSKKIIQKN